MRPVSLLAAAAAAVVLSASPAQAQTPSWGCEASALRATVLTTSVEPVMANAGRTACRTERQALADTTPIGLPVSATAVTAGTALTGDDDAPLRDRRAVAVSGVTGLRVSSTSLLPLDQLLTGLPSLNLLGIQLDLGPAIRDLVRDALPDLVALDAVTSYATGRCVDGRPVLDGASQIAGLRVLGQPLPVDQLLSQTLGLLDTASIDLSRLDLTKIQLPLGLEHLLAPLLQPALDALPPLALPASVVHVAVTPTQQSRDEGRLTQRALRVQVSLLNQTLVDLVVGEATVSERDVDCSADTAPGTTATDLALACTTRKLTLVDVVPEGRRVRLLGAADRTLAGREVDIVFQGTNDVVASPTVRADGSFSARAPLPAKKLRSTNKARYVAKVGRQKSLNLKLQRRMQVTGVRTSGGKVTIAGRVKGPLAKRAKDREVVVTRRLTCKRYEVVGRGMPRKDGTFRIKVDAPEGESAAVYRLRSKVRNNKRSSKLFQTFSLPRAVDLL